MIFIKRPIKLYLTIIILVLIVIGLGITYAYFVATIGNGASTNININAKTTDKLTFTQGNTINLVATQDNFDSTDGNLSGTSTSSVKLIANNNTNSATKYYQVYFNITENDYEYTCGTTPELILTITDPTGATVSTINGLTYVTVGDVSGFDVTTKSGLIEVVDNYPISTTNTTTGVTQNWTFRITFINLETNQRDNEGKTFTSESIVQKEDYYKINIANYTATSINTNIATIQNGTSKMVSDGNGNYRYSGAYDDIDNWVCFGSTASTCPANNLYRIIGVFNIDGSYKYKLIQGDFATTAELGTPYSTGSRYASYPGHTSQTTINGYQWNTAEGVTWGSGTTCNSTTCTRLNGAYLTNIGTTWSNLIATSTWYAYTNTSGSSLSASTLYSGEIASITYTGKVGLMSLSDYAYGATSTYWSSGLNTNYANRILNDWMYNGGYYEWTISQYNTSRAWRVNLSGGAHYNDLYGGYAVRPVFYLNSDVYFSSGTGERSTPYRITIS